MNNKLEKILSNWKFSKNIIDKYKSIGINEIFDWQSECLSINSVLGNYCKSNFYFNSLNI